MPSHSPYALYSLTYLNLFRLLVSQELHKTRVLFSLKLITHSFSLQKNLTLISFKFASISTCGVDIFRYPFLFDSYLSSLLHYLVFNVQIVRQFALTWWR